MQCQADRVWKMFERRSTLTVLAADNTEISPGKMFPEGGIGTAFLMTEWQERELYDTIYIYIHIYVYARIIAYPPQRIAGGFSRNFSRVSQIAKCNREQLGPAKLQKRLLGCTPYHMSKWGMTKFHTR